MGVRTGDFGTLIYEGDGFQIVLHRYSDPIRINLARSAATYLGKPDRSNIRRPLSILKQGHVPEIYRGEFAEFEFIDVSKEVYDHLITYTTRKMRVTGGNRALASTDYAMPGDKMKNPEEVQYMIESSMDNYQHLLNIGETKQVARSAMPVAAKMNPFIFSFNFLTLGESLFKQRIWEKGAQGNTVEVVKGMHELCHAVDPELWDTFYEYMGTPTLMWKDVRHRMKKKNYTMSQLFADYNNDIVAGTIKEGTEVVDYLVQKFGEQKSMW